MRIDRMTGYLLSGAGSESGRIDELLLSTHLHSEGQIGGTKWLQYSFRSEHPLLDEEQLPLDAFSYPVYLRRSKEGHILLLAPHLRVVDRILEEESSARRRWSEAHVPPPALRRLRISVHSLVLSLVESPRQYVLTRVDANVPAYGQALNFVSFYGEDIAESLLFRENIRVLRCYSCALKDIAENAEVLRITNKGVVSFRFSAARARQAEKALNFLYKGGFLRGQ